MKHMKTMIEKIDKQKIDEEIITKAGEVLKAGGLVAFPTETVYGLGANALNKKAAKKTYLAKGRPSDNPLIVHIAKTEDLGKIAVNLPVGAVELASHFWPGPLTLIFEKGERVPFETTGGLSTVAVRIPADEVARKIIESGGGFISGPSANSSGRPSPTSAKHVMEDLEGKIDLIIDSGSVDIGIESTILDMTVKPPIILRPGAITKEMLETVLGKDIQEHTIVENEQPRAPGMKYKHYAPKAKMTIIEGEINECVKAIRQIVFEQEKRGKHVGIIATNETIEAYKLGLVKSVGTRESGNSIAKNLYRILREFDNECVTHIYCEPFNFPGMGDAIMNRLEKAAGYKSLQASEIVKLQKFRRILFISNGDNSRGPMAAVLLKNQELLQEYEIISRGLIVLFSEPANPKVEAIMKSQGLTLDGEVSVPLEEKDFDEDTLVLTMDEGQKWKILSEYKMIKHVYTLSEFVDSNEKVPSAYGKPLTEYGEVYGRLKLLTTKLAEKLNKEVSHSDWYCM